jgi:hypothetical protein
MFVYVHQVARHLPLTRQIFARLIRKATEKKGKEKEKKRKKERKKEKRREETEREKFGLTSRDNDN